VDDPPITFAVAKDLQKVAGIPRRDAEVSYYNRENPLESVAVTESASAEWATGVRLEFSPETARLYEEYQQEMKPLVDWIRSTGDMEPTGTPTGEDVTDEIRQKARELGFGEVGFTMFDTRYVYASRRKYLKRSLSHAICLAVEQDYAATQTIPSIEAEKAQGDAYRRQAEMSKELVDFILSLGYRVQMSGPTWHFGPMIPMFVDAGLGQLGVNGQLLSPHFGSRARLQIILTDAKVTYDQPVDYGIHKFCELCQVCVMRCPGRALNNGQKIWYRGIEKNKLNFEKCRPVMTRYSGCGVCMKVCPIQKYGMKAVMDHYIDNGEVLGKSSDELEGYSLPDKGYFRPGRLPSFDKDFFDMPRGRTEDLIIEEFRQKLAESNGNGSSEKLWEEFKVKMEKALDRQSKTVDMGMDMII
jgi:epoxyqueuosine reductase QueG